MRAPWAVVLVVGDRRPLPRALLDEHLVVVLDELAHARRRERDAVLVRLDLRGDADGIAGTFLSWRSSRPRRASQKSMRSRAESSERPVSCSTRWIR